jgi:acetyl esterase/lipase
VDRFGGDREFVAIAGCSAGGHLEALAGLSAGDRDFEAELPPDANTAVDAVVGIYGRYDWEDRSTPERERFMNFLEAIVVRRKQHRHPDIFRAASPIARIHPDAPPFLVIHGTGDTLIPVRQARDFVAELRATSRSTVGYLELPGAQHAFDVIDGARTGSVTRVIGLFLNEIRRTRAGPGEPKLGECRESELETIGPLPN